jgi:NAD(P)-dependent dehydrogenase (short-subunit alcohol dehydrogenase family)
MNLNLAGKTVLVTGGSKGIGLACAQAFAAEGARIAICSRGQQNIDEALKTLPNASGHTADLTDAAIAADMLSAVEENLGPIDILINSAGAARRTPPADLSPQFYRDAMDAKFFSYLNVIDPLIKRMAARKSGVIINIIGQGGKIASPTHLAGGAANAALMLITTGLATAYAGDNIRVLGLNPGLTETGRVAEGFAAQARLANTSIETTRAEAIARIPLGRMATPQDVANAAIFLASEKAAYITGVLITMDGATTPTIL